MTFLSSLKTKLLSLTILIISTQQCAAYQPVGRWGHSVAVTTTGMFVYGGKTDQYNAYSYNSAPNSNDLLFLPLNSSFDSTSPPWKLLNVSSNVSGQPGPAVAWHTISTINDTHLMLFGGQSGPNTESFSLADSAHFIKIADASGPCWILEPQSWGNEPPRRMRHSSTVAGSSSFIIGGVKADGSSDAFPVNYAFDTNTTSFVALSNTMGPTNTFDHRSVILSDGRLLVLGGYSQSQGGLVPFSAIWSLNVRDTTPAWSVLTPSSTNLPAPRRAFAATLLFNDNVLIHGGADAVLQENYADGWILNTSSDPMTWTAIDTLTQLGPRRDHFAVSSGPQVLFGFGYSSTGPSPPTLYIYNVTKDAFVTTYTPSFLLPSMNSSQSTGTQPGSNTAGGPSVTGSGSPNPGAGSNHAKIIALAIVFSVLGAIIIIILVLYYMRRRRKRRGDFVNLADDDADSARSRTIPAVIMIDDNPHSERRSKFSIFRPFRFTSTWASTQGNKPEPPRRRDMLADEDAYVSEWYDRRRTGSERSSWSFSSFISARMRGQERNSIANDSIRSHRRETSDPFVYDELAYEEARLLKRQERNPGYVVNNGPTYQGSFIDFEEHEDENTAPPNVNSTPVHVPSSTDPFPHKLTGGLNSSPDQKPADSFGPHIEQLDSTFQTTMPRTTDIASTSLNNANRRPSRPIGRSDSWWKRFARHSFLDRKLSNISRKSPPVDYKDYNAPLMSIEEQTPDTLALKAVASRSVEIVNNHVKIKSISNLYDQAQHGKSLSSFRTADTEAIEKIGCMVDVVQRHRSGSHRSSSSSVDDISFEVLFEDQPSTDNLTASSAQAASSHVQCSDLAEIPEDIETDSATSQLVAGDHVGQVAAGVRTRKISQDNENPRKTGKNSDDTKVKYGLAPRQSLFVANPDK